MMNEKQTVFRSPFIVHHFRLAEAVGVEPTGGSVRVPAALAGPLPCRLARLPEVCESRRKVRESNPPGRLSPRFSRPPGLPRAEPSARTESARLELARDVKARRLSRPVPYQLGELSREERHFI
jgi:hypothetical protein